MVIEESDALNDEDFPVVLSRFKRSWAESFYARHKEQLKFNIPRHVEPDRAAVTPYQVKQFYTNLEHLLDKFAIRPELLANMDETMLRCNKRKVKVFTPRNKGPSSRRNASAPARLSRMLYLRGWKGSQPLNHLQEQKAAKKTSGMGEGFIHLVFAAIGVDDHRDFRKVDYQRFPSGCSGEAKGLGRK